MNRHLNASNLLLFHFQDCHSVVVSVFPAFCLAKDGKEMLEGKTVENGDENLEWEEIINLNRGQNAGEGKNKYTSL